MTPLELLELVKKKVITPNEFLKELSRVSVGLIRQIPIYDARMRVYRAQKNQSLPTNIDRMSYPPLHKAKLGRANLEGEQIFYASAGLPTTFNESRLKVGDDLYVGEWKSTSKMTLQQIGITLDGVTLNLENSVEHLFHEIFTNSGEEMYQYSGIISSHLLSGNSINGLLYPSIISQNQSHNIALKKDYADKCLKLISVKAYKIINISQRLQYETELTNFAIPLESGELQWKNRKPQWVIDKNYGELTFQGNGCDYAAKNQYGQLIDPT